MHELLLPVTPTTLLTASRMVLGFVAALWLGARLLPGLERKGYRQSDGKQKDYKLSGMTLYFMIHIALGVSTFGFGVTLTPVITHFWSIFIVANAFAIALTFFLFVRGRRRDAL